MNTLKVRNARQVALFHLELQGQISDGMWENTPRTGWRTWCDATAVVAEDNLGRDFYVEKDNFNLNAKSLLECVGDRMLAYARLADRYSLETVRVLEGLFDLSGKYRGMPTYEGQHYDNVRAKIREMQEDGDPDLLDNVQALAADESYSMDDMKADLRDLKKIFKTQVTA